MNHFRPNGYGSRIPEYFVASIIHTTHLSRNKTTGQCPKNEFVNRMNVDDTIRKNYKYMGTKSSAIYSQPKLTFSTRKHTHTLYRYMQMLSSIILNIYDKRILNTNVVKRFFLGLLFNAIQSNEYTISEWFYLCIYLFKA